MNYRLLINLFFGLFLSMTVWLAPISAEMKPKSNQFWWPEQLDLSPLRDHDPRSNPLGPDFNYQDAVADLDLDQVQPDVQAVLPDSQD